MPMFLVIKPQSKICFTQFLGKNVSTKRRAVKNRIALIYHIENMQGEPPAFSIMLQEGKGQ